MNLNIKSVGKKIKIPVSVDGGEPIYELRELEGPERDAWQNFSRERSDSAGFVRDYTDYYATLVAKCLYDLSTNKLLTVKEVQTNIPSSDQLVLFKKIYEISGLSQQSEADLKK